jgi:predicted chitinase
MTDNFFSNNDSNFYWFFGCVEDRDDPMRIGRVKLRILGYHTDDKEQLPTEDLPWAMPIMPANSASTSGIGWSPNGVVEGTWCWGFFMDGAEGQQPAFVGTINGVPASSGGGGGGDGSGNSPTSGGSDGSGGGGKVDPAALEKLKNCDCSSTAKNIMSRGNKANINAIIKACQAAGYSNNGIAAFLAIAGVESGFTPTAERVGWSAKFLLANFRRVRARGEPFARQLVAAGGIAQANFIYGSKDKGGNNVCDIITTTPLDGYKFRGHSFVQITGRDAYAKIGKALGVDLLSNPEKVNSSVEFSAKCCIEFYKYKGVKSSQLVGDNAIAILIKQTGNDTSTGNHQHKRELYKCFMENFTKNGNFI